jgi:hypothetical protein
MLTYFYVLNDYGIRPETTIFLNQREGYFPLAGDVYDADQPNFGNTNFGNSEWKGLIDWGLTYQSNVDLRLFYNTLGKSDYSKCRWDPNDSSVPRFYRISPYTNR